MQSMYYVYILQSCTDGSFYTGMTDNLERRLHEHNLGTMKYTKSRCPWKLVYSEGMPERDKARKREKYWKSGIGRKERETLLHA